jgi:hypothetical protein
MKKYNCVNCNKECDHTHQKTNKYCSNTCQHEYQYKKNISDWLSGENKGGNKYKTANYVKNYILTKQEFKCSICNISEWNGNNITLELDHVDGNPYNNNEENLRCICPNCHSQSDNYKAKNKGSGRHYRTIRYAEGKSY